MIALAFEHHLSLAKNIPLDQVNGQSFLQRAALALKRKKYYESY